MRVCMRRECELAYMSSIGHAFQSVRDMSSSTSSASESVCKPLSRMEDIPAPGARCRQIIVDIDTATTTSAFVMQSDGADQVTGDAHWCSLDRPVLFVDCHLFNLPVRHAFPFVFRVTLKSDSNNHNPALLHKGDSFALYSTPDEPGKIQAAVFSVRGESRCKVYVMSQSIEPSENNGPSRFLLSAVILYAFESRVVAGLERKSEEPAPEARKQPRHNPVRACRKSVAASEET